MCNKVLKRGVIKMQYIIGPRDSSLKREQVFSLVFEAIGNVSKVEKYRQTKSGCLVISASESEAEKIAKDNPALFVEADVIHSRY